MTELEKLMQAREQADAEFAAARRQVSEASAALHKARNKQKVAQRQYIEFLESQRKAA